VYETSRNPRSGCTIRHQLGTHRQAHVIYVLYHTPAPAATIDYSILSILSAADIGHRARVLDVIVTSYPVAAARSNRCSGVLGRFAPQRREERRRWACQRAGPERPNDVSDVQTIFCTVTINQKFKILLKFRFSLIRLQCADTVGWASGRASACKK